MDSTKIIQLNGLKPKNKGQTNFYECCNLTKKSISKVNIPNHLWLWHLWPMTIFVSAKFYHTKKKLLTGECKQIPYGPCTNHGASSWGERKESKCWCGCAISKNVSSLDFTQSNTNKYTSSLPPYFSVMLLPLVFGQKYLRHYF